jgi:hypothetical protein
MPALQIIASPLPPLTLKFKGPDTDGAIIAATVAASNGDRDGDTRDLDNAAAKLRPLAADAVVGDGHGSLTAHAEDLTSTRYLSPSAVTVFIPPEGPLLFALLISSPR